ncbi:MAG: isoprenylcysteine carboxylmethyltransferase family protein [Nitrososphaerota archaeon]|nr:isoprenylcysteine carboxylmethyltransferase family protein [Nitrososphaerota archaeon]
MPGRSVGFKARLTALIVSWILSLPTISSTFWLPMWIALSIVFPTIFNYFPESPAPLRIDWIPQWVFRILYIPWIPFMIVPGSEWLTEYLLLPWLWTNTTLMMIITTVRPILALGGFLFFIGSLTQLLIYKRRGVKLVTSGFYGIVRHPQYLGIILWTLGHVLYALPLFLRPADLIAWVTLVYLYILLARNEERDLTRILGEEYTEYRERTPFILPFIPVRISRFISASIEHRTPKDRWVKIALKATIYMVAIILIAYLSYGRTYCFKDKPPV